MLRSNSDPNLLLFDPELERTLRCARQLAFTDARFSQTENRASENNSTYSSDSNFNCDILSSSDTGTSNMGDLPRITLKQMGIASDAQPHLKCGGCLRSIAVISKSSLR
ncbi:hypothetical protein PIB30_091614 [Stylosanthes scabra]|uniref:Uncharacterized protein n=1 Tax=Stylosanthes scabra TaxID=79078 RepID=A0ABU6SV94_9FABA|nr:hypothetical protein [Stylosanthes scabra]